jgi:hypothetical protein
MSQLLAGDSCTSFQDLPTHIQGQLFASAGAPINTCKASADIAQDVTLAATWLLAKHHTPLLQAAKHRLWDVCVQLLTTFDYQPCKDELQPSAPDGSIMKLREQLCEHRWSAACRTCPPPCNVLTLAVRVGCLSVCQLLVNHPSITALSIQGAICEAALIGEYRVLQLLISLRPDTCSPTLGVELMRDAAQEGHVGVMQLLQQLNLWQPRNGRG